MSSIARPAISRIDVLNKTAPLPERTPFDRSVRFATIAAAEHLGGTMTWLKCTAKRGGEPVYVNLDNAVSVYWSDRDKGTVIAFVGGEKDAVTVEEKPEYILQGR
jgi:hypothetical protein